METKQRENSVSEIIDRAANLGRLVYRLTWIDTSIPYPDSLYQEANLLAEGLDPFINALRIKGMDLAKISIKVNKI